MMYFTNAMGYLSRPYGMGRSGFCGPDGFFGWHMGGTMILLILAIAVIAYLLYNKNKKQLITATTVTEKNEALDLLAMRYAKGEIDEETYIKMKQMLKA